MSLDQLIDQVRPYLREYLESRDVKVSNSGSLRCINPDHPDKSASMQLATRNGNAYAYCNGCHSAFDIFAAAGILEKLPTAGIEWVEDNVLELANRFQVPYEKDILGQPNCDPKMMLAKKAYNEASIIVHNAGLSKKAKDYTEEHGWTKTIIDTYSMGSISVEQLSHALVSAGYQFSFLEEIGLMDRGVFHVNNLIFTIHDHLGRPVGFTARRFIPKEEGAKYINSSAISAYSPYRKNEILFNLHLAKKMSGTLYLVEGQTDAITAYAHGIRAISLNGSAISSKQVSLLNQIGLAKLAIWMDPDPEGQKALGRTILPTVLQNQLHPLPNVIEATDNPESDPDCYIREHDGNLSALVEIDCIKAYANYLQSIEEYSRDKLAETLIDICSSYQSPIARSMLSELVSKYTDISATALYARLEELDKQRLAKADERRARIIDDAVSRLKKDPQDANKTLITTLTALESVTHTQDSLNSETFLTFVKDLKTRAEERENKHPGFLMTNFPGYQKAFEGEWVGKLLLIAGAENSGKSTLATALNYNIVSNPENDAMVIMHVTDDGAKDVIPRLVCLADRNLSNMGLRYLDVEHPKYTAWNEERLAQILDAREKAYQSIFELISDERIIVKDARASIDIDFGAALIRFYRQKHPKRKIIYCLDSINRAGTSGYGLSDERSRITSKSNLLAQLAVKYDVTTMTVCEFNRKDSYSADRKILWPDNQRLAEARALEYDADGIILLYNDLHVRGDSASILWRDKFGTIKPRVISLVTKNKISNWKGKVGYDFDEIRARFSEVDSEVINTDYLIEEARIKSDEETQDQKVGKFRSSFSHNNDQDLSDVSGFTATKSKKSKGLGATLDLDM